MIAIFGASGFLGGNLYNYFQSKNPGVIGTYYNRNVEGLLYFDMISSEMDRLKLKERGIRYAVISTGESGIDAIKEEPE
ncbi:MAG: hypothetical protein GY757_30720, partial [bacterium]|nr:hypothetical protein [bacterium]